MQGETITDNNMFNRTITHRLEEWKKSAVHKPLVLRGARQVGKTTLVNDFGGQFPNYLYLNLERTSDRKMIEMDLPLDALVSLMFARKGLQRQQGDTLIFMDEIQNSPKAMALLRYFHEDTPQLHIIAAGSLLENMVDVKMSFPVGRVDFLPLRPCSFREFVAAIGQQSQLEIMSHPEYTPPFHQEYLALFNQYCIVGGMPEAVQHYADHADVIALPPLYSRLQKAYMDDVEKYALTEKTTHAVRFIMQYGWSQAGSIVTLGNFEGSSYKSREMGEAFRLLQKAMLLELAYPSTSAQLPAIPELRRMPKLFWFDTGMVNYAAKVRKQVIGANDILDVWKGRIAEQVVAQELLTLNDDVNQTRSFWTKGKGESGAEVDLTWVVDSELIPIEVKSGHNAHLRSLHSFIDAAPVRLAVRVWSGPFSVDDAVTTIGKKAFRLINLPFYSLGNLEDMVRKYL